MKDLFLAFLADEDGASTTDMVLLMAALVGLCLAVTSVISRGLDDLSGDVEATIIAQDAEAAW